MTTISDDKIEELAKWFDAGMDAEGRGPVTQLVFAKNQATFLRSLSTKLKELEEAKEALDWILDYIMRMADQMKTLQEANCPSYLRKRLGKEG